MSKRKIVEQVSEEMLRRSGCKLSDEDRAVLQELEDRIFLRLSDEEGVYPKSTKKGKKWNLQK